MSHDNRRITMISSDPKKASRDWDSSVSAPSRIVTLDSFTILRYTIVTGVVDLDVDLERVILDKTSSAAEYLSLLAALPPEFRGDVLLIRDEDNAFLSATGRGGDRVLYALSPTDLRFYLETNGLVTERVAAGSSQPASNLRHFFSNAAA